MSASGELPAGRELDALVAEKVMGWRLRENMGAAGGRCWATGRTDGGSYGSGVYPEFELPEFSMDMNAAWKVVTASNTRLDLFGPAWRGLWTASFSPHPTAQGETAPLAICRAALKAVDVALPSHQETRDGN